MFGHQNNEDDTQNSTNPALPGTFPAGSLDEDNDRTQVNPALPNEPPIAVITPNTDVSSDEAKSETPTTGSIAQPRANTTGNDELLEIKKQALSQLSPLVGHLEQTSEEKFRTTMMMIQATDNQDLVKDAYTAAQEITDEKIKAQALLDIVNEINYFTQHHAD